MNVVLVVVDCLRQDYAYNKDFMPCLNRECCKKVNNGFTNCTTTWGAVPTLTTGFMPFSHVNKTGIRGDLKKNFLPNIAKKFGFKTLCISANTVVSHHWGYDFMFDYFEDFLSKEYKEHFWSILERRFSFMRKRKDIVFVRKLLQFLMMIFIPRRLNLNCKTRGSKILEELQSINLDKDNNFLWLYFMEPHRPYAPLGRIRTEKKKIKKLNVKSLTNHKNLTLQEKNYLKKLYENEVYNADKVLKKVFDYLKTKLHWDNTLLVVLSDHGESLGEGTYFGHESHKLSNPQHIKIPIFFGGGLSKSLTLPDTMFLRDIYFLIVSFVTGKTVDYEKYNFCVGYVRKSGTNIFNDSFLISSYHFPEDNKFFESTEELAIDNLPEALKRVYFSDEAIASRKKILEDSQYKSESTKEIRERLKSLGYVT